MADRFRDLGLLIDLAAIRNAYPRATIGRKHLADWLAGPARPSTPATPSPDISARARARPQAPLDWRRAIALIRGAGGVAGLAHPPYDLRQSTLAELAEGGLGSIEVAGPASTASAASAGGGGPRRWAWPRSPAPTSTRRIGPAAGSARSPPRPTTWIGSAYSRSAAARTSSGRGLRNEDFRTARTLRRTEGPPCGPSTAGRISGALFRGSHSWPPGPARCSPPSGSGKWVAPRVVKRWATVMDTGSNDSISVLGIPLARRDAEHARGLVPARISRSMTWSSSPPRGSPPRDG